MCRHTSKHRSATHLCRHLSKHGGGNKSEDAPKMAGTPTSDGHSMADSLAERINGATDTNATEHMSTHMSTHMSKHISGVDCWRDLQGCSPPHILGACQHQRAH